ncbi:hypothetical protein TNCT_25031 [Trichonephila clavata]|uniref:Uncharacterized protein n=1 Tax=Trichonephila clavata TaxID=2740835 RepID=A0A8X6G0M3_TRICU|nr:hypothetical protein TNCT_25031 [Trichonephila clavata]
MNNIYPDEDVCSCSCSNSDVKLQKIVAVIKYTGFKENSYSCSCEDFLIPRLQSPQPSLQGNKTCELCNCKGISESKCPNGKTITTSIILIEVITVCISGLVLLARVFYLDYESRIYSLIPRKSGYKEIEKNKIIV